MTRFAIPLTTLLLAGVFLVYVAALSYVKTAYKGQWTRESRIEALNYAVQTITTVGYGNWEETALSGKLSGQQRLDLREVSIYYMFAGGFWFALFTGIVVAAMTRDKDKKPSSAT